ncbi:PfkB family carbohydrate kinase, partial [Prochlorococcus sp. AH-716-O13]|nr:PfkB family carbohydrate kinase [Prochlorococcus sp. AH-716-O13]
SEKMLNRPDVIITDGANPILWFINGVQGVTQVFNSPKVVDTTGAGDSFLAGLISQLLLFNYPTNESEIQNCVKFASVCGLLTCLGEGAIEQQPDHSKIKEFFWFPDFIISPKICSITYLYFPVIIQNWFY